MWKKWYEAVRVWLTRERLRKMDWYGALALLLILLGAGSHAYRSRRIAPEIEVPQAAMVVGTPRPLEALLALPGVGRKIANLVLGDVYGLGGIVADTHFMRICSRLGFTPEGTKDVSSTAVRRRVARIRALRAELGALVPEEILPLL